MDPDELANWLLEELTAADEMLSDAGADRFQSETGPWLPTDEGRWTESTVQVYQGLRREHDKWLLPRSRTEVVEFLARQAQTNAIPFGIYPTDPPRHAEQWASRAIAEFFKRLRPDSKVEQVASEVAERLLTDAYRDHHSIVERILLMRPQVEDVIEVGEYVLRPPDQSDGMLVTGSLSTVPTAWMWGGALPTSVLERRYRAPLDIRGYPDTLHDLLVGLMLADVSFATGSGSIRQSDSYRDPGFVFSAPSGEEWRGAKGADAETLEQAVDLATRWRESEAGINRSCHRLLRSTRDFADPSDRIVDIVIAMEALLTDGSKEQLGYQFRLMGALLLGETFDDRREIRDELKAAYNERSSIVHSNKVTNWSRETIDGLADMARRLCARFVEHGRPDFDALLMG